MVLRCKSQDMDCDKNKMPWPEWRCDVTWVGKRSYKDLD